MKEKQISVLFFLRPALCVKSTLQIRKNLTHKLTVNILISNYDIIFSESRLDDLISNSEILGYQYKIYRCDKNQSLTEKSQDGGVLVNVHVK